jgi:uncharacterized membrane protein
MGEWFDEGNSGFVMFGWEHILNLIVLVAVVLFMYIFRLRIKEACYKKITFYRFADIGNQLSKLGNLQ